MKPSLRFFLISSMDVNTVLADRDRPPRRIIFSYRYGKAMLVLGFDLNAFARIFRLRPHVSDGRLSP